MNANEIIATVSRLTGIKQSLLHSQVEQYGLKYTFERPSIIKATKTQKEKFKALVDLIHNYREIEFANEKILLDSSEKSKEYFSNRLKVETILCDSLDNIMIDEEKFTSTFDSLNIPSIITSVGLALKGL